MKRRLVTLVLAALAAATLLPLAAQARIGSSPAVAASAATTFAVIGDYGMDNAAEASVAALVSSWSPAFIIATGDDYYAPAGGAGTGKYDESTGAWYGRWLKDISTTGTRYPFGTAAANAFFPALGNHDYSDAGIDNYLAYFTLPGTDFTSTSGNERYYDFVQGPVHFFVLNSCSQEPDGTSSISVQAAWLQRRLGASTSPWNIVYDHHPPYSSDASHGSSTGMQWPFAAWGAHVVISGHAHTYERIMAGDGLVYFVNGLGGAGRYSFTTPVPGSAVRYNADWGAQRVTVTDTALVFAFYNTAGGLIDSYTVTTTTPAAPTGLTAAAASSSQINLTWTDAADNEAGFTIERSLDGATWTQVASVAANATSYASTGLSAATTYSHRVRAFNGGGLSAWSNVATATTSAPAGLHVGNLEGTRTVSRRNWSATVTITIHDAGHTPVSGAVVKATWSGAASGSASATTNSNGTCTLSKANLKLTAAGVTLTVTSVTKSGFTYLASANHDPDGSSNGTKITIAR